MQAMLKTSYMASVEHWKYFTGSAFKSYFRSFMTRLQCGC